MSDKDDPQRRMNVLVLATGIVLVAVVSLQSPDIPVRRDMTSVPHSAPVGEDTGRNSDNIPYPPPVPPALQKGFLR